MGATSGKLQSNRHESATSGKLQSNCHESATSGKLQSNRQRPDTSEGNSWIFYFFGGLFVISAAMSLLREPPTAMESVQSGIATSLFVFFIGALGLYGANQSGF